MPLDIYWFELDETRSRSLIDMCGDDRYRVVEPYEIIPILPDDFQTDYARNLDTSLIVKKIARWDETSSSTVVMADLHRRDEGGYAIDQQPFLLAHHSGSSTPSASGMFVNEGDWQGRTTYHFTGPSPLETLSAISSSELNNYYPGSGLITNNEGSIDELYNSSYRHTLDTTIDLMRPHI